MERTWEISDLDGGNKRTVTLAQFRAELDVRRSYTQAIFDAVRRGDMAGAASAQRTMRAAFNAHQEGGK